jgi:hypothetical protein
MTSTLRDVTPCGAARPGSPERRHIARSRTSLTWNWVVPHAPAGLPATRVLIRVSVEPYTVPEDLDRLEAGPGGGVFSEAAA